MYLNEFTSHTSSRHEISEKGGTGRKGIKNCIIYRLSNRGSFDIWYEVHLNAFLILAARSLIRALSHSGGRAVELLCPLSVSQLQYPKFPPFISYFQYTKNWLLFFTNNKWTTELPWWATRMSKLFFACIWALLNLCNL